MGADLMTRILMDDRQFTDTLEKSKKQISRFNEFGRAASGMITKMAVSFGVATSATEAFRKIINSTQSNTDGFNSAMEQVKAGVDSFFDSIAMGNFNNLISGFDNAMARARELYDAMDTLGDMQAGWSDKENEKSTKISENIATITDPDTSLAERKKLLAENKGLIAELEKSGEKISKQYATTVVAAARREAQMDNVTEADVKRYLQEISMHDDHEFYSYLDRRSELQQKANETIDTRMQGNYGAATMSTPTQAAKVAKEQLRALKDNNTELEKYAQINELISDDKRKEIVALRVQGRAIDSNIAALKRQQNTTERRYGKEREAKGGGKIDEIIPEGSIAELEKRIQEAKKALANATTDDMRLAADNLIEELEAKKAIIEVQFKVTDPGSIGSGGIAPLRTATKLDALQGIDKLKGKREALQQQLSVTLDPASMIKLKSDLKGIDDAISALKENFKLDIKLPDTGGDKLTNISEKGYDAADGIFAVTSALHDMSYALDNSAGAWVNWAANTLSAIGQAIPAIATLTATKKAEATANAESAATGAASSVASVPIVGPILAVAAIASIIAAFANLPKFAFGGIVPGNSFSGDKMLARVNSGEIILNSGQQSNLFRILNDGSAPGGTKKIELELSNKNLVAAIEVDKLWRSRR